MARYNEIQVGWLNRYLQKLLSMKGEVPAPQLGSEIMPVLPFFTGIENRYIGGWDRFGNNPAVGPTVGSNSALRFRNPVGSNMVAVVESLIVRVSIADLIIMDLGATNVDLTPSVGGRLDPRGRSNAALINSLATGAAAVGAQVSAIQLAAALSQQWIQNEDQEMAILPGDALQIRTNALNETLGCGIIWRERFLEDSERA